MNEDIFWKVKVLAYVHDPAEKALILFRSKGHEAGTVAQLKARLQQDLGYSAEAMQRLLDMIKKGDRWASSADRPSLPMNMGGHVNFAGDPRLRHPLSGEELILRTLESTVPPESVEAESLAHYQRLIVQQDGRVDWKKTFLSMWRFGPCAPTKELGALWGELPADTRSPDHSIWDHLSLTSAFAGTLAAGGPALLLMSFGPVQGFIAQARSISDLWAGSHLLSSMVWAALEEVCERYGPDVVLFPKLHGVPQVDLWVRAALGEDVWNKAASPTSSASQPEWIHRDTDRNPLFVAALPNRFVALVPAEEATDLADQICCKVRRWVQKKAQQSLEELGKISGLDGAGDADKQLQRHFKDFPETFWAVVPWRLAGDASLADEELKRALEILGAEPCYLGQTLESLLRKRVTVGSGAIFYQPNPGVAYPGLYELLERLHAATKTLRITEQSEEKGYRCSLCGEREWLAHDRGTPQKPTGIYTPPGQRQDTLWTRVAQRAPALAKEGEHLCGWCALKRTWPRLFAEEICHALGKDRLDRFVLSTHAIAVSTSLWRWLELQPPGTVVSPQFTQLVAELETLAKSLTEQRGVALPAKLYTKVLQMQWPQETIMQLKRIPALLDAVDNEEAYQLAVKAFKTYLGFMPETYYALVLLDGDQMGRWLAAAVEGRPRLADRFHAKTLEDLQTFDELQPYLEAPRLASPAWHQAVSSALNAFSIHVSRKIVEDLFMGKLIYAGGDDLMAMVAVHDLPALMFALRCAFSGCLPQGEDNRSFWKKLGAEPNGLKLASGYALVNTPAGRELHRLMGKKATASIGAVIAHHQAPLARVLGELRAAIQKAKSEGGRDAFCLTVCKRSGGTEHLVGRWELDQAWQDGDMGLLLDLRDVLAHDVSRRVAYELSEVFRCVPAEEAALAAVMACQFRRKAKGDDPGSVDLAHQLATRATRRNPPSFHGTSTWPQPNRWLRDMLLTAEFLAREGRVGERAVKGKEVL
ncbi:type III-B CRISPR-associated protein Cas10/Cmr2 [Desulfosoma sp.]|uniref:type III-B CRISPR-associated protein Cas10/Cmr2 n=1 Tax=Desulfosoma sp. TaxID=2603217 RepID=UPI0040497366